jgi:hypothetical protein
MVLLDWNPWSTFGLSVAFPLLVTLVMWLIRVAVTKESLEALPLHLGWDACVLGLGLVGTVAASPVGHRHPMLLPSLALVILGLAVLAKFAEDRRFELEPSKLRRLNFTTGFVAIGMPSAVLFLK